MGVALYSFKIISIIKTHVFSSKWIRFPKFAKFTIKRKQKMRVCERFAYVHVRVRELVSLSLSLANKKPTHRFSAHKGTEIVNPLRRSDVAHRCAEYKRKYLILIFCLFTDVMLLLWGYFWIFFADGKRLGTPDYGRTRTRTCASYTFIHYTGAASRSRDSLPD